jgi:hypothetical protein
LAAFPSDSEGWGYDQHRAVGPDRNAGTVAIYLAACPHVEPDHGTAADTGAFSSASRYRGKAMTNHAHRDQDRNPTHSDADSDRRSMVPFALTAVAAIVLIAVLSPRFREVHYAPIVYAEAIAPGPIPSTERRPSLAPIK